MTAFATNDNDGKKVEPSNVVEVTSTAIPDFNLNKDLVALVVLPSCDAPWANDVQGAVNNGASVTGEPVYNYDEMRVETTVSQQCYDFSCWTCTFPTVKTKTKTYYEYF